MQPGNFAVIMKSQPSSTLQFTVTEEVTLEAISSLLSYNGSSLCAHLISHFSKKIPEYISPPAVNKEARNHLIPVDQQGMHLDQNKTINLQVVLTSNIHKSIGKHFLACT